MRNASDGGEARRQALWAADRAAIDEARKDRLAIVVAEMASNLAKHASGGGEMLISATTASSGCAGVEVVAIDRGPGIADPAAALEDCVSSAGTLGVGLGSICRQADDFDIHTAPKSGTAILARFYAHGRRPPSSGFDLGVVAVARDGEEVSGDGWSVRLVPGGLELMVVDGLGHGLLAADAAQAAIKVFKESTALSPADMLRSIHDQMRATRGATVAITSIDAATGTATYAGIGNVAAAICDEGRAHWLVSLNGTVGRDPVSFKEFKSRWTAGALLVMHSDGLTARWRPEVIGSVLNKDPSLVAAVLFRDFGRDLDDATVLVARQAPPATAAPPR